MVQVTPYICLVTKLVTLGYEKLDQSPKIYAKCYSVKQANLYLRRERLYI